MRPLFRFLGLALLGGLAACDLSRLFPGFEIALDPSRLTVVQGDGATTRLTLTPQGGFTGRVSLSLENAPQGVSLFPTVLEVLEPRPLVRFLTVQVGQDTPAGTYRLRLWAYASGVQRAADLVLAVQSGQGGGDQPLPLCAPRPQALTAQALRPEPQGLGDFAAPFVPGELLVLPGGLTPQALEAQVAGARVREALEGGFLRVRVPEGKEEAKALEFLQAGARYVQPNYLYRPLYAPNDPLYSSPLDPSRLKPHLDLLRMEAAWDRVRATSYPCTPLVAVLDTAFHRGHEDVGGLFLPGYNATPDGLGETNLDPSPPPSGFSYPQGGGDHGQGVAGLVAAVADNGRGIPGLGLNRVRVLPIKVFYWAWGGYTSTSTVLAQAIRKAADQGAVVINLSLGSSTPLDRVVEDALAYALSKGALPVAAAGNDGVDGLYYPAAHPGVLAVGAVRLEGTRSDFSNYSSTPKDLVMAPGGNRDPRQTLYSLALGKDYPYYASLGNYANWRGTSFAAPLVSAVAALYVAHHNALRGTSPTPDQIKACLKMTASNGGVYDPQTGYGIVRADRVLTDPTYCFP